jgi:hypothetical protein
MRTVALPSVAIRDVLLGQPGFKNDGAKMKFEHRGIPYAAKCLLKPVHQCRVAPVHPLSGTTCADTPRFNRRSNIGRLYIGQLRDCSPDCVSPFHGTLNNALQLLIAQALAIPKKTLVSDLR